MSNKHDLEINGSVDVSYGMILSPVPKGVKYVYAGDMPTILSYSESREICLREAFMNFWYGQYKLRPGYEYFEVNEANSTMLFDISFLDNSEKSKFDVYSYKIVDDPNTEGQQILMISHYPFVWGD